MVKFFDNREKIKKIRNQFKSAFEIRIIIVDFSKLPILFSQFFYFLLFKFMRETLAVFCLAYHSGNGIKIISVNNLCGFFTVVSNQNINLVIIGVNNIIVFSRKRRSHKAVFRKIIVI